jgi:hypothetical protein
MSAESICLTIARRASYFSSVSGDIYWTFPISSSADDGTGTHDTRLG